VVADHGESATISGSVFPLPYAPDKWRDVVVGGSDGGMILAEMEMERQVLSIDVSMWA
jgi:hypothetical protein